MDLIVNNIDFLKPLLNLRVVTILLSQVLVHLNDLSIVLVNGRLRLAITICCVNLKLLQSLGQLLVVFLEGVNLGLAS